MRAEFPGHFPLTQSEIDELMREAWFVFDTNALLNLYRYTEALREDFFDILSKLGGRIQIPRQVADEFFKNRVAVILEQNGLGKTQVEAFRNARNKAMSELNAIRRNAPKSILSSIQKIEDAFDDASARVVADQAGRATIKILDDPILTRLSVILKDSIRPVVQPSQVAAVEKWAQERYDEDVPPGFRDKKKPGREKFGDAKIWREILDMGQQAKKPVVFVTDDVKEDWWLRVDGETIGPLPQLRNEFMVVTGQNFHMYQAEQFLLHASAFLQTQLQADSLTEAAEVRERQADQDAVDSEEPPAILGRLWSLRNRIENLASERKLLQDQIAGMGNDGSRGAYRKRLIDVSAELLDLETAYSVKRRRLLEIDASHPLEAKTTVQEYVEIDGNFRVVGAPRKLRLTESERAEVKDAIVWIARFDGYFTLAD